MPEGIYITKKLHDSPKELVINSILLECVFSVKLVIQVRESEVIGLIKTIEKQNVVDEVFDQIKSNIMNSVWKPGEMIPSENELCRMFNVSRVSVRSAIQKLRAIGIIETRHGKGSFVSSSLKEGLLNGFVPIINLSEKEFFDMLELRETIEFKCIDLAVQRAEEKDIEEIGQALQKMIENQDDYVKFSMADLEFHLAIVKASQNDLFLTIMNAVKEPYHYYLTELNRVFGEFEESIRGHREQYEAIKNRDSEKVKELMSAGMNRRKAELYWNQR